MVHRYIQLDENYPAAQGNDGRSRPPERLPAVIVKGNSANQGKDQEGDDGDGEQKQEVGHASLQPMHLDLPRAEPNLTEVQNPECQRNAEQNSADGCEGEMQGRPSYTMA